MEVIINSAGQSLPHSVEQLDGIPHEPVGRRLKNVVPTLGVYAMGHQSRMVLGQTFVLARPSSSTVKRCCRGSRSRRM